MFQVFSTREFDKDYDALENSEKERVESFVRQIAENPSSGKPLGLPFFREKKFDGRRMYFLVYETLSAVLLVAMSDKKSQEATIEEIKERLSEYRGVIHDALKDRVT